MSFEDKSLRCADCGATFIFTVGEQEFFMTKGLANEPRRCPQCRRARRLERENSGGFGSPRQMYAAVCAACGQDTEVPFEPLGYRPVYCQTCFNAIGANRGHSREFEASAGNRSF